MPKPNVDQSLRLIRARAGRLGALRRYSLYGNPEEFIGLMLGDGCINSPLQASVYFNAHTDVEYADFVEQRIEELFGISPRRVVKEGTGEGCLMVSKQAFCGLPPEFGHAERR